MTPDSSRGSPPPGYTFYSFRPLTVVNSAVPIFLFQSGHGGGVESHKLLLQKIANTGYCVIVPQHPNDTGNNQYGLPPNKEAAAAVFTGNCLAELQTDGTHLEAAYKWVLQQTNAIIDGQKVDITKVVTGGFSAGCIEAINHLAVTAEPGAISGLVCISPSTASFVEQSYKFSKSVLKQKAKHFTVPTLWITSEEDLCNLEAMDFYHTISSKGTTLISFNDNILDLSLKLTEEFSIWGAEMAKQNPGLAAHMALACEEEVVADTPIVSFMGRIFGRYPEIQYVRDESMAIVLTK